MRAFEKKLQELALHWRVKGAVYDLSPDAGLVGLYSRWDAAVANASEPALDRERKANAVLFGCHPLAGTGALPSWCAEEANGIHDILLSLKSTLYRNLTYVVVVGDDRLIPFGRLSDQTDHGEETYPDTAAKDVTSTSSVGKALKAGRFLSDDPLAVEDVVDTDDLDGSYLFIPDFAVGRLVERPDEMVKTVSTFLGQDGVLDLTALSKKVLVTGYDFLDDGAKAVKDRWRGVFSTGVDTSLIGTGWGQAELRQKLSEGYGLLSLSGHATHYEEGVPGTTANEIQGVPSQEIYGPDKCGGRTAH